ncbi:hypothetical protein GCM10010345_52440 [Streptomyces canarius]|uniref:Uncharacterized protein n=1 Tax=Streptomyces canarius TaxID=285453 RepID=A0ABQ3CT51_9ACTN|nr:hypothetical protein GCM10010345_52440 [Streptomyces canarius]
MPMPQKLMELTEMSPMDWSEQNIVGVVTAGTDRMPDLARAGSRMEPHATLPRARLIQLAADVPRLATARGSPRPARPVIPRPGGSPRPAGTAAGSRGSARSLAWTARAVR